MSERISCCIPFCKRTRGDRKGDPITEGMEWMCGDHWQFVPARLKRRRAKVRRIEKRHPDPCILFRSEEVDARIWAVCKAAATERAAGI